MILPKREDAYHKVQLYRLLTEILDSDRISSSFYFKGGTAASMLGFLDRFSVDLDFDLKKGSPKKEIEIELTKIFSKLEFMVDKKSSKTFYYILKYQAKPGLRNSLKLSFIPLEFKSNIYKSLFLPEIDRYANCQTIETMFGNKLVALIDRFKKTKTIAGRDLYDIHHFFLQGFRYNSGIISERTKKPVKDYLQDLVDFINSKVTEKIISEDLSYLLSVDKFKKLRRDLKNETVMLLKDEIKRVI